MAQNSRAWFPGTYIQVSNLAAVEVLPVRSRRVEAAVSKGTVFHGTRSQILAAAHALLAAVAEADKVTTPAQ
jgi:hypothetical protein